MTPHAARDAARRNERLASADMAAFARALAQLAPELGSVTFPFADGHAVLCGRGMYVNHVLGAGFDTLPDDAEFDRFEAAAAALGRPARLEVHEHTIPELAGRLAARGYVEDADDRTAGLALELGSAPETPTTLPLDVRIVESDTDLARWQEATAAGWGHHTPERRLASDRFCAAAHATQTPGLLLAHSPDDGRIVGCASLSIGDSVAQLGGMSTMPAERGRGVQQALVRHRLDLARAAGCELAVTHADVDGGSIRNLRRLGFVTTHTKTAWSRPLG